MLPDRPAHVVGRLDAARVQIPLRIGYVDLPMKGIVIHWDNVPVDVGVFGQRFELGGEIVAVRNPVRPIQPSFVEQDQ